MITIYGSELSDNVVTNYIGSLINKFYKILPIKESGEPSLPKYMASLQRELIGCNLLLSPVDSGGRFLSLISILQYLIDNETDTATVKSEVFKAISICKEMQNQQNMKGGDS